MKKEHYFMPLEHPALQRYPATLDQVAKAGKGLQFSVNPDTVAEKDVDMSCLVIAAAQHKASWIDALLFGLEFKFTEIADSELYHPIERWAADAACRQWFHKMGQAMPFCFYFFHQWEARFLTVTGDMIGKRKEQVRQEPGEKHAYINFDEKQTRIIHSRVGTGSQLFIQYCYQTGIDPRPPVEAMLAEFKMGYEYELVQKKWQEEHDKGVEYGIGIGGQPPEK